MIASASSSINGWDVSVDRAVHRYVLHHRWSYDAARLLTHLGDPVVVTIVTLVVAGLLAARRRYRTAVYVLAVRAVALVLDTGLKHVVGRPRPHFAHPLAAASGFSFPSGHALGAAALCGSLACLVSASWPRRLAIAVPVPLIVAASRVALGVHYVTDVAGGLLVGWAVAASLAAVLLRRRPGSPSIAPVRHGEREMNRTGDAAASDSPEQRLL